MICPNCSKNTPEGKFCEHCGARLPDVTGGTALPVHAPGSSRVSETNPPVNQPGVQTQSVPPEAKNKWLAAVLSLVFTGLGQVYNGEFGKGIGFLLGAFFFTIVLLVAGLPSMLSFIVVIISVAEAYMTATKMSAGILPCKAFKTYEFVIFFIIWVVILALNIMGLTPGSRSGMGL